VLDLYLRTATEVIVKWDGFVTQFVGDEVMAFFNVPLARDDFGARAVAAATELQNRMPALSDAVGLPVQTTIGIAAGHARVGLVGAEQIRHYSAIGDVVNRAARLVARVEPGGILVDDPIYAAVANDFPNAEREQLLLKGFDEPVGAVRLRGDSRLAQPARDAAPPKRPIRLVTALSALLGAPCAGGVALHMMGVAVASASFGLATALPFLEQDFVRFPLMAVASLGALANLAVVRAARADARASAAGSRITPTRSERRRTAAGVALSVVALGLVGFEIVIHKLLHG
jgi:hypothetical protein